MLTQIELEDAFKVHFGEMDNCEQHKCYWALLHLIVVLPHICSGLESVDGESHGNGYKKWCGDYLSDSTISSEDWHTIRNGLLHQGKTLPSSKKHSSPKKGYTSYSFSQPTLKGGIVHRIVFNEPSGMHLHLDVGELKKEILIAVRKWFRQIEERATSSESNNVKKNLPSLARVGSASTPLVQGLDVQLHQSITTSSPWQGGK
jgi:hypothetical protein